MPRLPKLPQFISDDDLDEKTLYELDAEVEGLDEEFAMFLDRVEQEQVQTPHLSA